MVANLTVAIGKVVKVIGAVLASLILVSTLGYVTQVRGDTGATLLLIGIVLAGLIGVFGYALGTLVAAQGQILLASLDSAVSLSPFLSDELRAEIMSL